MTKSLRRRHLIAWLVLGPACVLLLAAALVSKPRWPRQAVEAPAPGSTP